MALRIRTPTVFTPPPPKQLLINVAGAFRPATVWINVAGAWKVATPFIKVAGVWK